MNFVRVFWVLSLMLFLAADLFVYADIGDLSNIVKIPFEGNEVMLSRLSLFYYSFTIMLVVNLILLLTGYAIPYLPKEMVLIPKKENWFSNKNTRKLFYKTMKEWIRGFALLANSFLIVALFTVYYMNSVNSFPLGWAYYLIGILTIVWLIAYFPIFNREVED